jgi:hypothetical protein
MTIINVAITARRAAILTDSATFSASNERIGLSNKCIAFPNQRLLCAGMGQVFLANLWRGYLLGADVTCIDQVNAVAPAWLSRTWNETSEGMRKHLSITPVSTLIVMVGVEQTSNLIKGFHYSSDKNFQPEPLQLNCVHLYPGIEQSGLASPASQDESLPGGTSELSPGKIPNTTDEDPSLVEASRWSGLMRVASTSMRRQKEKHFAGGRVIVTTLTPVTITTGWPNDLDDDG